VTLSSFAACPPRRLPVPAALVLAALVLAAGVACNDADRDAKTEPVLLPEGFTSETNPQPSDPAEDPDRFIRTDVDPGSDSTTPPRQSLNELLTGARLD
jgi:hypothetical protein